MVQYAQKGYSTVSVFLLPHQRKFNIVIGSTFKYRQPDSFKERVCDSSLRFIGAEVKFDKKGQPIYSTQANIVVTRIAMSKSRLT